MDYKKLNALFADIINPDPAVFTFIEHTKVSAADGSQGSNGEFYQLYQLKEDGIYVKFTYTTDSYNDGSSLSKIEFVKPIEKTITAYETI